MEILFISLEAGIVIGGLIACAYMYSKYKHEAESDDNDRADIS